MTDIEANLLRPDLNQPGWWRDAVVYQIYPRSFADANGDGIGDLRGIINHVDHLADLGVKVLWLSPIYRSPMDDNGYDISDYQAIDPLFGTMADFDELLAALHARGIRLLMDLVVNHTSDEHAWFEESRSSRENPKRDWYWWRDPAPDGGPPNPWRSFFSGSAWQLDETTGQYYLHLFSRKQPDLNWENPQVRQAVFQMMRWWLERGVDGFRMDVINLISKRLDEVDDPHSLDSFSASANGPRLQDYLQEMHREVFDSYPDRVFLTVGEMPGVDARTALEVTDPANRELDMVFQFEHVGLDQEGDKFVPKAITLATLAGNLALWQETMGTTGWNSLYLENHDQPRSVSRWGDDDPAWQARSAKVLLGMLHAHRGTPYVYQGQELGLPNLDWERLDQFRDLETLNYVAEQAEMHGRGFEELLPGLARFSRDNARTPMPWTADAQTAGFTTGEPWIGVNAASAPINVAAQVDDPGSVLGFTRRLIGLRKEEGLLVEGDFELLSPLEGDSRLWAIRRRAEGRELLALGNLSRVPLAFPREWVPQGARVLLDSLDAPDGLGAPDGAVPEELKGWQVVYLITG